MMYKQSTAVIALLLSSSSALQQKASRAPESDAALAQVDDEATVPAPEQVHVLEPELYQAKSNSREAFPNPYRTAFYVQQGHGEDPAVFGSDEDPEEKAPKPAPKKLNGYKGNHLLPAEKVFSLEPVTNRQATTFYDKRNGLWRSEETEMMAQKPDIGRAGYDKAVRHFVNEDTSVHPTPYPRRDTPFDYNGSHPSAHSNALAQDQDIGRAGYDKAVRHFVNEDTSVHPTPYPRRETPFAPNGSHPSAHDSLAQKPHHHKKSHKHRKGRKDIGEGKVDPEVHGMVASNDMVSPIPNWRKETAYPPNGWDKKAHSGSFTKKKDIGEKGIDAEVHGMASANNMVSPIPNWRKETAYPANGWDPKAHSADFMAKGKRADIGTEQIDE